MMHHTSLLKHKIRKSDYAQITINIDSLQHQHLKIIWLLARHILLGGSFITEQITLFSIFNIRSFSSTWIGVAFVVTFWLGMMLEFDNVTFSDVELDMFNCTLSLHKFKSSLISSVARKLSLSYSGIGNLEPGNIWSKCPIRITSNATLTLYINLLILDKTTPFCQHTPVRFQ